MSEKILQALMQLFAIVANAERLTAQGRSIVTSFLKQQLSQSHVNKYLAVFDEHLILLQGKSDPTKVKKRVSVNSVKVLRICTDINSELDQKQKYIVLIRLIEFAYSSDEEISEQESEFLNIVSETFNISPQEYNDCLSLAAGVSDIKNYTPRFLMISNDKNASATYEQFIYHEGLAGRLYVLFIRPAGILFTKYFGDSLLTLNGIPVIRSTCYILTQGSVIRGPKMQALYFSDIMQRFMESSLEQKLSFDVKHISYTFKNGKTGLHPINFSVNSGNLIGIMGGSGAGKSTLLNVLNTNLRPDVGEVLINGKNIHQESPELEGIIGYVPQDDLLIEDLSVFQNLFYSSKLCFGGLPDEAIRKKSVEVLHSLGLSEISDLQVGSVLEKTISGGQRKRLNIALELIREPAVLFVDEPTSGLSSRDSENVMDLLKQLAITGKLIFVVIHQPSSDIFKMFDKLMILDIGGYPVYFGNPSDSLMYFKSHANYADADDSECYTCGNINPEQVFAILESKVLDEFGNFTSQRKILPEEWNRYYTESKNGVEDHPAEQAPIRQQHNRKPSAFNQFTVFLTRDVLAKMRNHQYLWINLLEAPVLAFILAYFLRYKAGEPYIFRENMNLPAFIFMSVIVSLFIGLMVSAEEIIRDRKIRKREAFLNLSKMSYLLSKITILFTISAMQTALFLLVGSNVLDIKNMFADYWMVLFSVSCFANLLGLNISASFDEAVTIYILIPFLIIPQILMSGIMVKFDEMNPTVTCYDKVPAIGESMISRWAFEALAVNQYKNNDYEKHFFAYDRAVSNAYYKKDFWLIRLDDKLEEAKRNMNTDTALSNKNLQLIISEIQNEVNGTPSVNPPEGIMQLARLTMDDYIVTKKYLQDLNRFYVKAYNSATENKEKQRERLQKAGLDAEGLLAVKNAHANESVEDLLLKSTGTTPVREYNGKLIRNYQPVYIEGSKESFIRAQFFVNSKSVFGKWYSTYWINVIVMWLMSLLLSVALYFNWLRKLIHLFASWRRRLPAKYR